MGLRALGLPSSILMIISLGFVHGMFTPADNYLINCGSPVETTIGSRTFAADMLFSTTQDIPAKNTSTPASPSDASALLQTARIFTSNSSYSFPISRQGRHWIRLHFFPFLYRGLDLSTIEFSVLTQDLVLLGNFRAPDNPAAVLKEYSVKITSSKLVLSFIPSRDSAAFVNAIELVSVPDSLFACYPQFVDSPESYQGISEVALETIYRINMGGPVVTPENDTLSRTWVPDHNFLLDKNLAQAVPPYGNQIKHLEGRASQETAPDSVYRTAITMAASNVMHASFNVTWEFPVDPGFVYLLRFHFCDIVSQSLNLLFFDVYVNGRLVARSLDLSSILLNLAAAYAMDFISGHGDGDGNKFRISIGPSTVQDESNAILNGLEIMRVISPLVCPDGQTTSCSAATLPYPKKKTGLLWGSTIGASSAVVVLLALIFSMAMSRWRRKKKHKSQKSVPSSTMNRGALHSSVRRFGNKTLFAATPGFQFSFVDLREATNGFDEELLIGKGGFGKVYKGVLRGKTKVAVKRGNPRSQQGLDEFGKEIELLSQLHHRHLVALIGYCTELDEKILVYEYMENGNLRSHLYGSDLPPLSWRQRLEICIGAARGLHYLHTGGATAIIHRDVKSTNILLDGNLTAKVADFGLSRAGPELDQTHVSTAVKGSFGYFDPEYFRTQQLTEKTDVYSFGVVLLEVLCARSPTDPTLPEDMNLAEWAMLWQKKGQLEQVTDPRLAGTTRADSLKIFGDTVEKCLADCRADRASMGDVLQSLECALQLQEVLVLVPRDTMADCEDPIGSSLMR